MAVIGKVLFNELLRVVDYADGRYSIKTEMRADEQRLRISVAYASNAAAAFEIAKIIFEFRPERGVFDVVDLALKASISIIDGHSAAASAEMGMIVYAEKNVEHAISL